MGQVGTGLGLLTPILCARTLAQWLASICFLSDSARAGNPWKGEEGAVVGAGQVTKGSHLPLSTFPHCWSSPSNSRVFCDCQIKGNFCPN